MSKIRDIFRPTPLELLAALLLAALLTAACGGDGEGSAGATGEAGHDHGSTAPAASADAGSSSASGFRLPTLSYPPAVRQPLDDALTAYEDARELLAADELDGLPTRARRLAGTLALALGAAEAVDGAERPNVEPAIPYIAEARRAAEGLEVAAADGLDPAREAFSDVSRFLMAVAAADPELVAGRFVYSCPMTGGFNKWMQAEEEMENPYMGTAMLTCGSEADWTVGGVAAADGGLDQEGLAQHAEHVHGADPEDGLSGDEIAFYTCPMHPSVKSPDPGACPLCGMDLVAVSQEDANSGVVLVDERRRQLIGVKTATATTRPLTSEIRAVGTVTYDESRLQDVSVKYPGWIGRLYVDEPGQRVGRGQALFTLYSPELYAAQQDFITALASQRAARGTSAPERADYLVRAARERLRLWDLSATQIDRLAETGEAVERIPILSPASGYVVEKNVVEGAAVKPGERLFRIAGLERVWVEAEVYESELPLVEEGQAAVVTLPSLPGEELRGTVSFIYPYLDGASRTGKVRIELANPGMKLKPDMFADVRLRRELGERLAVPETAVLYAGDRSYVFVDLGEGRLRPQRVETGRQADGWVEILSGVESGDSVVTSGNFLIAAESRLKSAMDQWQ